MAGLFGTYSVFWWLPAILATLFILKKMDRKKARILLVMLLSGLSFGFKPWLVSQPGSEQAFSEPTPALQARQTINAQGLIAVHPIENQPENQPANREANRPANPAIVFQHLHATGAAQLTETRPLNGAEWIAIFNATGDGKVAPGLDRRYQGWFESEIPPTADALPLVRRYKSLGGSIRVEDEMTHETIFVYPQDSPYQPVAIVKQAASSKAARGWQVLFSAHPGLLSEKSTKQLSPQPAQR